MGAAAGPMTREQDERIAGVVAREGSRLRRFIRARVADPGDVEDVLQDVFAELVEANRLLMPIDHVTGWLFRVASNRITDLFRKKRPERFADAPVEHGAGERLDFEELLPSPDAGPDAVYVRGVLIEALEQAVAELPEDQRVVFVAHEIEGRSFKEMAAESGVSINTLLSRKRYAVLRLRERLQPIVAESPAALRLLVSAHASHEELFLVRDLLGKLQGQGADGRVTVSWRTSKKAQPATTKFPVPAVDAPNVAGARLFGFDASTTDTADVSGLRGAIEAGAVKALCVLDPGPEGSLGDVQWLLDARAAGKVPFLVVLGPLMTPLAAAADIVLAGAAWVEKDATYTNDRGQLQGTSRVMAAPGEAREDWLVITKMAAEFGIALPYADAAAVRAAMAAAMPALAGIAEVRFSQPLPGRTWLQASNPSERWKWDHMFQDLPPVKTNPVMQRADLIKPEDLIRK